MNWLWPKGWQRNRDLNKLRKALLDLRNLRVYHERWEWFLVDIDRLPTETSRFEDPFRIYVRHLPDSDRGPWLHRIILRKYGAESTPKWRAYLGLSYIWDHVKSKNGNFRIHATQPAVERGEGRVILDGHRQPVTRKNGRRKQTGTTLGPFETGLEGRVRNRTPPAGRQSAPVIPQGFDSLVL